METKSRLSMVLGWKMGHERLKVAGTLPRDLPTKPKKSPKPKPVVKDDVDNNKEEVSDEDGYTRKTLICLSPLT